MAIYFTSDEHFHHKNIIRLCNRPFADIEDMHEQLIHNHNAIVQPADTVYHLGDFCWNWNKVKGILSRLNGEHHLIMGNHDQCHPVHDKGRGKYTAEYIKMGFKSVQIDLKMHIGPHAVKLCHFPYMPENTANVEEYNLRYPEFRPKNEGGWLIHGHVHNTYKQSGRMINVGVDQFDFSPVSEAQLLALINSST